MYEKPNFNHQQTSQRLCVNTRRHKLPPDNESPLFRLQGHATGDEGTKATTSNKVQKSVKKPASKTKWQFEINIKTGIKIKQIYLRNWVRTGWIFQWCINILACIIFVIDGYIGEGTTHCFTIKWPPHCCVLLLWNAHELLSLFQT